MLYFTLVAILRSSWQKLQQKQSYFIKAGLQESQAKGKLQKEILQLGYSYSKFYILCFLPFFFFPAKNTVFKNTESSSMPKLHSQKPLTR